MTSAETFHLVAEHKGLTLSAVLKRLIPNKSWSEIRKLIATRRVQVSGNLCLYEGRKVKAGEVIKIHAQSLAPPVREADVRLVFVDEHLIVVQKPAGVTTLRHREETDLPQRRKQLQPTLDELVQRQLGQQLGISLDQNTGLKRQRGKSSFRQRKTPSRDKRLQIRPVHRLDRDTSGLMLFARTPEAEQKLIHMFARHEVQRAYVAVVHGHIEGQTIETWLVRDRGDGLRGSTPLGSAVEGAQHAVTHIRPLQHLANYTVVECHLETGRTHQIRIHLSEMGHQLCGEKLYTHAVGEPPQDDTSGAPRQALHAADLALLHPITGRALHFRMPLPPDMKNWLLKLQKRQE